MISCQSTRCSASSNYKPKCVNRPVYLAVSGKYRYPALLNLHLLSFLDASCQTTPCTERTHFWYCSRIDEVIESISLFHQVLEEDQQGPDLDWTPLYLRQILTLAKMEKLVRVVPWSMYSVFYCHGSSSCLNIGTGRFPTHPSCHSTVDCLD